MNLWKLLLWKFLFWIWKVTNEIKIYLLYCSLIQSFHSGQIKQKKLNNNADIFFSRFLIKFSTFFQHKLIPSCFSRIYRLNIKNVQNVYMHCSVNQILCIFSESSSTLWRGIKIQLRWGFFPGTGGWGVLAPPPLLILRL